MKLIIIGMIGMALAAAMACSTAKPAPSNTSNTSANSTAKKDSAETKSTSGTAGFPTAVTKEIYDHAIKHECSAIPPMLTEDFRKAVGSSKDELDALCDTFSESGKITSIDVTGEELSGDKATVKVSQNFKDGKKVAKEETLKKSGDKWLMDS